MTRTRFGLSCVLFAASVVVVGSTAQAELAYGITGASAGGSLVTFDTATPGTVTTIGSLGGILAGHSVRAIDFRPATKELYALSTATGGVYQLYTVNLTTAALTPVGSPVTVTPTSGTFTFPTRVSMDFNPVADRLRVVTGNTTLNNLRINPNTGAFVALDGDLAYAAGDVNAVNNPPFAVGAAYTNNFAGATSTTLYTYDFNLDVLATIGSVGGTPTSPNTGTMFTVGGPTSFLTNDGGVGFDISGATGIAYLSYADTNTTAFTETLGQINLATGITTPIGAFGGGIDMLDISIVVPEPSALTLLALPAIGLMRRRRA